MDLSGGRKFHEKFVYKGGKEETKILENSSSELLQYINNGVIGNDLIFNGAFGDRKVLYCDYTASGRSLQFIEEYITDNVLPHYGNTHTTTTVTSLQTTMFRQEARDLIRKSVNASESDAVIFTSSGCTGAVHKLIHGLNLQAPPIVIVSPYEHHSNLIPWKEVGSKIIWSKESKDGKINMEHLEIILQSLKDSPRPILGCFAAASNVTGIIVNVDTICHLFHKYNALIFVDYATSGPYVDVNMNPSLSGLENTYKDAIFISTHKFIGGPGTPGILIVKKKLFTNPVPESSGGGTVFFVTKNSHRYLKDIEMREEGGTPAIIESIRAGLVFQLKDAVRASNIAIRDSELLRSLNYHHTLCPVNFTQV